MAEVTVLPEGRRPILVVSHERSGTHFTMNAIAAAFGYVSAPHISLDRPQFNINFFYPQLLAETVRQVGSRRPANILKSHHPAEFFGETLDAVAAVWRIVYVHRHPADVMASYWRFLNTLQWNEGPAKPTVLEFAMAPPWGRLMRYQYSQHPNMLERWAAHVEGWVDAAERTGLVHVVRYEDLAGRYAETVRDIGAMLGQAPGSLAPPSRDENVIKAGPVAFNPSLADDNRAAVGELARLRYPELMTRLGYGSKKPRPTEADVTLRSRAG
jgi:hypothetical protein